MPSVSKIQHVPSHAVRHQPSAVSRQGQTARGVGRTKGTLAITGLYIQWVLSLVADPPYRLTKNVFSLQSHATRVRFQEFGLLLSRTLNILKEPLNELPSILEQLAIE